MDNYSRDTVKLLLERHPEYLDEILFKFGLRRVPEDTPDSIYAMITHQKQEDVSLLQSSIYTCRCGSTSVVTREVQTRSTDEGSKIIHICTSCGLTY